MSQQLNSKIELIDDILLPSNPNVYKNGFKRSVSAPANCSQPLRMLDTASLEACVYDRRVNGLRLMQYGKDNSDEELEKEYTVLKSKEHIEQVELRRLRSENKLVKHRIDNLEKENVMLADRLIQGQVTRAHEAEDMFVVKRELSTLRTQHSEALEKLEEANDMISNMKLRADSTASNESNSEELIRSLRHELNDTRMRAMSQTCTVQEMKGKVRDLEEENSKLRRDPDCEVQTIQEELIAVKLREAEANLSMKELRQRVNEMEQHWQKYQERSQNKEGKASKSQLQSLHDELMTVKLREAETLADLKEMKQKVMEFETQNHICSHQIKRLDEENRSLKEKLDESLEREKILKSEIQQWERRADDGENRRKEEEVMQKICAAEHSQAVAEMRRKVAELEIKNQELLTSVELKTQSHTQDLENQIADLEDEVVQLRLSSSKKKMTFSTLDINKVGYESDSEAESEDMDTTITDSGKFRNNLSSQYFPIYEDNGEVVDEEGMPIENVNESNPQQGDGAMEASHDNDKSQVLRNVGHSLSESGDRTVHSSGGRLDSQNNVQVQKDNENTSKLNGNTYDAFSDEMERALDNLG